MFGVHSTENFKYTEKSNDLCNCKYQVVFAGTKVLHDLLCSEFMWRMATSFFLTQQTLEGLPHLPGLENGPGFDSQGSVNFFTKYCFPNLHRIHVKAFEVEDCEFVPVHHQPKVISSNNDSASRAAMLLQ